MFFSPLDKLQVILTLFIYLQKAAFSDFFRNMQLNMQVPMVVCHNIHCKRLHLHANEKAAFSEFF
jgi:hypothetical protein